MERRLPLRCRGGGRGEAWASAAFSDLRSPSSAPGAIVLILGSRVISPAFGGWTQTKAIRNSAVFVIVVGYGQGLVILVGGLDSSGALGDDGRRRSRVSLDAALETEALIGPCRSSSSRGH